MIGITSPKRKQVGRDVSVVEKPELDLGVSQADIRHASQIIAGQANDTPLVPSTFMSERGGQEFLLKLENMQPIGAFKLRGALNAVMALPEDCEGVTCCSTGNHGRGVAFAARARGLGAVICMSALVPQTKIGGIKALGAEVVGLAAALAGKLPDLAGPVATIITGRNLDMNMLTQIVTGQDARLGEYVVKGQSYAP